MPCLFAPCTTAVNIERFGTGGNRLITRMATAVQDLDAVPGVNASPDAATKGFIFQQTMYRIKVWRSLYKALDSRFGTLPCILMACDGCARIHSGHCSFIPASLA